MQGAHAPLACGSGRFNNDTLFGWTLSTNEWRPNLVSENGLVQFLPPIVKRGLRSALAPLIGFTKAKSWSDAVSRSVGYEDDSVLSSAATELTNMPGPQVTSRDLQVLAAFFAGARAESASHLRVLDIGGAAGSYFDLVSVQRPDLTVEWTVVETPNLVRRMVDRRHGDSTISWVDDLQMVTGPFDLVLLSSVLQYVDEPYTLLSNASTFSSNLLINRIPLIDEDHDVPTVQHLRMYGHKGSYPAWFFSEHRFMQAVEKIGAVKMQWKVPEDTHVLGSREVVCLGMIIAVEDRQRA